jgi:hypothetical protein
MYWSEKESLMSRLIDLTRARKQVLALGAATMLAATALPAQAHVKWFSRVVDCNSVPLSPMEVITAPFFIVLYIAAVATMLGVFWVERQIHPRFQQANEQRAALKSQIGFWLAWLLRIGVALYFVLLVTYSGDKHMILTPELVSGAAWIPAVQLAISLAVLWRRTVALGAAGIVFLYGYAAWMYGLFHMMDYPYFLGVAAFLVMDTLYGPAKHYVAYAALRASGCISLFWVSTEKWVYPTWAYDILDHELHMLTMGLDTPFFVLASGFVEFSLAFLIMFGRLSSQVCAFLLLLIMVSMIPIVGMMDLVGHAPLLVALIIFTLVQNRIGYPTREVGQWLDYGHALTYALVIPGTVALYFLSHLISYPERGGVTTFNVLISVALAGALIWRLVMVAPQLFPMRKRLATQMAAIPSMVKLEMHDLMRLRRI